MRRNILTRIGRRFAAFLVCIALSLGGLVGSAFAAVSSSKTDYSLTYGNDRIGVSGGNIQWDKPSGGEGDFDILPLPYSFYPIQYLPYTIYETFTYYHGSSYWYYFPVGFRFAHPSGATFGEFMPFESGSYEFSFSYEVELLTPALSSLYQMHFSDLYSVSSDMYTAWFYLNSDLDDAATVYFPVESSVTFTSSSHMVLTLKCNFFVPSGSTYYLKAMILQDAYSLPRISLALSGESENKPYVLSLGVYYGITSASVTSGDLTEVYFTDLFDILAEILKAIQSLENGSQDYSTVMNTISSNLMTLQYIYSYWSPYIYEIADIHASIELSRDTLNSILSVLLYIGNNLPSGGSSGDSSGIPSDLMALLNSILEVLIGYGDGLDFDIDIDIDYDALLEMLENAQNDYSEILDDIYDLMKNYFDASLKDSGDIIRLINSIYSFLYSTISSSLDDIYTSLGPTGSICTGIYALLESMYHIYEDTNNMRYDLSLLLKKIDALNDLLMYMYSDLGDMQYYLTLIYDALRDVWVNSSEANRIATSSDRYLSLIYDVLTSQNGDSEAELNDSAFAIDVPTRSGDIGLVEFISDSFSACSHLLGFIWDVGAVDTIGTLPSDISLLSDLWVDGTMDAADIEVIVGAVTAKDVTVLDDTPDLTPQPTLDIWSWQGGGAEP